ncbi:F-box domain-containing protein [Caenorhabditis elegans]|uniref:F-box domain-containing protein n=1 Tax=Caenorhabditis elegans TaxID=6239 RepID=O44867_CAEEL|nr:F-box domain-containing protein [Caenorhabditis elegans]CCD72677.1 F-box domain-containing protein [Caenorhabditis elegans]|eukprot:NP_493997.1 Uncharacterized protein CELE_K05F6.8 [Caenorhabditis elegans]
MIASKMPREVRLPSFQIEIIGAMSTYKIYCQSLLPLSHSALLIMVAPSFPLLNLPEKSLKEVFCNMSVVQQTCISMISEKTKNLVRKFHIFKQVQIWLDFSDSLRCYMSLKGISLSIWHTPMWH